MPKVRWAGVDDIDDAAKRVGPRIRKLRESRGLTIRQLAERVGISKNTLLRLEQGEPIAEKIFVRICDGLQTVPPNLLVADEEWNRPYRVHRTSDNSWRIAFRRERAPSIYQDWEPIDEAAERQRIGNLGFVSGFLQSHHCSLRDGLIQAAVLELYGDQEKPGFRHSGEEYVLCLEGKIRITIGKDEVILEPGDAVTFWSRVRHKYANALPPRPGGQGAKMLMLWIESIEDPSAVAFDDECEQHP